MPDNYAIDQLKKQQAQETRTFLMKNGLEAKYCDHKPTQIALCSRA